MYTMRVSSRMFGFVDVNVHNTCIFIVDVYVYNTRMFMRTSTHTYAYVHVCTRCSHVYMHMYRKKGGEKEGEEQKKPCMAWIHYISPGISNTNASSWSVQSWATVRIGCFRVVQSNCTIQSNPIRHVAKKIPFPEKKSPRKARFNLDLFGQTLKRGGPSDEPPRLCTGPLYLCS